MKENPMRHLMYGVLAGLVLVAPAAAQPTNAAPPQSQAAKDNKSPADQAASKPPQGNASANPAPAKDDSMANYDVNGSSASDAMGTTP